MSEQERPQRPIVDSRHPHWCQAGYCEIGKPDGTDHRSAPVTVETTLPLGSNSTLWLSKWIYEPLDSGVTWVNLRISETRADGTEIVSVHSFSFPVAEAARTGAVMALLARRGADQTLISEEQWRAGRTDPPTPGFGPLPGALS